MRKFISIICLALFFNSNTFSSDSDTQMKDQDKKVNEEIRTIFETFRNIRLQEGTLALRKYFIGLDTLYNIIELERNKIKLYQEIKSFIKENETTEFQFDKKLIELSSNLIFFKTFKVDHIKDSFVKVDVVDEGYNATHKDGYLVKIRKLEGEWKVIVPDEMKNMYKEIEFVVDILKLENKILKFRLSEAKNDNLSLKDFEKNLNTDLVIILKPLLKDEHFNEFKKWATKTKEDVVNFYKLKN